MVSRLLFGAGMMALLVASPALASPDDPLQIFVSKDTQSLVVYEGLDVVATSDVSTGKPGHTTPSGIFSILEKKKTHFSNLYDSAPMPWMQRLTWSGVALHESKHVPRYPASHGCVRMPAAFAKQLFSMTKRGYHVIITDAPVTPVAISHANLFMPAIDVTDGTFMSDAELRSGDAVMKAGDELALNDVPPKMGATAVATLPEPKPPIRMLVTRTPQSVFVADAIAILNQLGYEAGEPSGQLGKTARKAIRAFQELHGQAVTGTLTPELSTALYKMVNREPPAHGRLFVRRNFKDVLDLPVEFKQPDLALGTHFFIANEVNPGQRSAEWMGVSLPNPLSEKTMTRLGITAEPDVTLPGAAEAALDRLVITDEIRERIAVMLGNGSSLTISDQMSTNETGLGTDFITILNKPRTEG